jgi:hypothetical protein
MVLTYFLNDFEMVYYYYYYYYYHHHHHHYHLHVFSLPYILVYHTIVHVSVLNLIMLYCVI